MAKSKKRARKRARYNSKKTKKKDSKKIDGIKDNARQVKSKEIAENRGFMHYVLVALFWIFLIIVLFLSANLVSWTITGNLIYETDTGLQNYPSPFVVNGKINGIIVAGDNVPGEEIVGAIDIANNLAAYEDESAAEETEDNGEITSGKIETSSRKLTLSSSRDGLKEIRSTGMDKNDLPTILADGEFTNKEGSRYEYDQSIKFSDGPRLQHYADSDYKSKEPNLMVYLDKNNLFLNYTLDFTKSAVSSITSGVLDDFEEKTIEIMGNKYDITKATTSGSTIQLSLMGGAVTSIMGQGDTKIISLNDKDYNVKVTYIGLTNSISRAKFTIDGEITESLAEGETFKLSDGTTVGVRDIMEEESGELMADQVEFYMGVNKIELDDTDYTTKSSGKKNGDSVGLNDEDVDGLYFDVVASLDSAASKLSIDEIIITWIPDDEVFITKENSETLPGLESFVINFEDYIMPANEETQVSANSDNIELDTEIESGDISFNILGSDGTKFTRIGGSSSTENLVTASGAGATITFDTDTDEYFVATYMDGGDGESYLLEISDIDDINGVDIKDAASGTKYEDKKAGSFSVGSVTLTLSAINETDNNVSITGCGTCYFDRLVTNEGLLVNLPVDGSNINIAANPTTFALTFTEEDRNENIGSGTAFDVNAGFSGGSCTISSISKTTLSNSNYYEIGDSDNYVGYAASDLGTKIKFDENEAVIDYHGGESYANVFVSETNAESDIEVEPQTEVPGQIEETAIEGSIFKLASEAANYPNYNMIIIGGPCANPAAEKFMDCANWPYSGGQAIIKMYDSDGKNALLVAGTTKEDTKRAIKVIANYADYNLDGEEFCVTGAADNIIVTEGLCQ